MSNQTTMLHRKFRQTDCLKETFALANHNWKVYEYSIENNPDESDDWTLSINWEFVNSSQALWELSEYANWYDDALSLYDNEEWINNKQ